MAATSYGATNPQALDPYPIESVLAKEAVGGSTAQAQNMLELYQMQRKAAGNVYLDELSQQHQFNRQQLAQQMQEAYIKAGQDAVKTPGGLSLLSAQSGGTALGGFDPTQAEANLRAEQEAKTFQSTMTGLNQGSQGGYQIAGGAIPGLAPNVELTNKGPALAQAATIRANAAAAGRAAGGAKEKLIGLPIKYGTTGDAQQIAGILNIRPGATDEEVRQQVANARRIYQLAYGQDTGLPGATPPAVGGEGGSVPPAPSPQQTARPPKTNLQTAPPTKGSATTTTQRAADTPASSQFITDPKTQAIAQAKVKQLPSDQRMDVIAHAQETGGVIPIVQMKSGAIGFVGKHGINGNNVYTLPQ